MSAQPAPSAADAVQFKLTLCLKEAHELIAMDKSGTSDPYVKVKVDGRTVYRTKTIMKQLDPLWNETCEIPLNHLGQKVALSLYDYDRGSVSDDFLGRAEVDLTKLEQDKSVEHKLELTVKDITSAKSSSKSLYRGFMIVTTLLERLNQTDVSKFITIPDSDKQQQRPSNQRWRHILEIVVGNVRSVPAFNNSSSSTDSNNVYQFRIGYNGSDFQRSKTIALSSSSSATLTGRKEIVPIGELFTYHIKEEKKGQVSFEMYQLAGLGDNNGKVVADFNLNLADLAIEQTHKFEKELIAPTVNCCGLVVQFTLTITGTRPDVIAAEGLIAVPTWNPYGPPLISPDYLRSDEATWTKQLAEIFSVKKTTLLPNEATAGVLALKVIQANNLIAADFGGKSDPFVCIEIVNVRLRTHTEYKTLQPKWNRTYVIPIDDIHSTITITVFDEDENGKPDFLGKIAFPVAKFNKESEQRSFALKSSRLRESSSSRGSIELAGCLIYNKPLALLRSIDPKEKNYLTKEEKITINRLQLDVDKINKVLNFYRQFAEILRDLMCWTRPKKTIVAIFIWIFICLIFQPWMVPFTLTTLIVTTYCHIASPAQTETNSADDDNDENEEKLSLVDRLNKLQDLCFLGHRILEKISAFYERLRNIVFWRSPLVSTIALVFFGVLSLLCLIVPLRYLLMAFGVYELTKTKFRPYAGFEAYDLISRAHTDAELAKFREQPQKNYKKTTR